VKLDATAFNLNRPGDEIDEEIGLGTGGQPDFLFQHTRCFLNCARVVEMEVGKRLKIPGLTRGAQNKNYEKDRAEAHEGMRC
jgi:hypothetical protein